MLYYVTLYNIVSAPRISRRLFPIDLGPSPFVLSDLVRYLRRLFFFYVSLDFSNKAAASNLKIARVIVSNRASVAVNKQ